MQKTIEPVDIELDKPRKLLINHGALLKAEVEVNRMRGASPFNHASIDILMIDGFRRILETTGALPHDLLRCMLWAGLLHEDPKLTIGQIDDLLDASPKTIAEITGISLDRLLGARVAEFHNQR